jgi:hypothetical protein
MRGEALAYPSGLKGQREQQGRLAQRCLKFNVLGLVDISKKKIGVSFPPFD